MAETGAVAAATADQPSKWLRARAGAAAAEEEALVVVGAAAAAAAAAAFYLGPPFSARGCCQCRSTTSRTCIPQVGWPGNLLRSRRLYFVTNWQQEKTPTICQELSTCQGPGKSKMQILPLVLSNFVKTVKWQTDFIQTTIEVDIASAFRDTLGGALALLSGEKA